MNNGDLLQGSEQPDDCPRGYPKTKDEWWQFVKYYRQPLRDLVAEFHPVYARWGRPMKITAPGAEQVSDHIREEIERETIDDPLKCFDQFVEQRSEGLAHLLGEVWFGIPESRDAHSLPAFGVLCDLCSESYVLEPEQD